MLEKIKFKNYKLFKDWQELELKPITILIGKNSSGKSAVLKLPTLIESSISGSFSEPLRMNNNGIELGGEFKDLIYGRQYGNLEISLSNKIESECSSPVIGHTKNPIPTCDLSLIFFHF